MIALFLLLLIALPMTFAFRASRFIRATPSLEMVSEINLSNGDSSRIRTPWQPIRRIGVTHEHKAWLTIRKMGEKLAKLHYLDLLIKGTLAGIFVGFGGIIMTSVGFNMGGSAWIPGKGVQRFICGAFGLPFANMLMTFTGAAAWTGDSLSSLLAYKYSLISTNDLLRVLTVSYIGCYLGNVIMSILCSAAGLRAVVPCMNAAAYKYTCTATQVYFKAIFGSMIICCAIFGAKTTDSFVGKVFSIWAAVMTQVACDFEHSLSSMFFLTVAAINSPAGTFSFTKYASFLLVATLGNLTGIALMSLGLLGAYSQNDAEEDVYN